MEDNGWTIANQADRLTSGNQYGLFDGVKKSKTRNKSGFVFDKNCQCIRSCRQIRMDCVIVGKFLFFG